MKRIKMLITVVVIISITCIFSGCDQIIGLFGRGNFGTSSVPEADLSNLPAIEGVDFAYEMYGFTEYNFCFLSCEIEWSDFTKA